MAEADLARGRQAREGAEVGLSYTEIRSPVAGRVVDRLADPGDTALPGKPLLSVYDPRALRIEVPVRESLAIGLKAGTSLQVRLGAGADVLTGAVDEIVPQAEAGSRTFLVKVGLPAAEGIYAGMFGRILIPLSEEEVLVIPRLVALRLALPLRVFVGDGRTFTARSKEKYDVISFVSSTTFT